MRAGKLTFYGAALIGGYLILKNFTGFTRDASAAANGTRTVVTSLQGR